MSTTTTTTTSQPIIDEFERTLLSSPNNTLLWVKYASVMMKITGDYKLSHKILERALRTISFREDEARFNIWLSILNLSSHYDISSTKNNNLMKLFERATSFCGEKKIHLAFASILKNSSNPILNDFLDRLSKKYPHSCKVMLLLIELSAPSERPSLKALSLKQLPKRKHPKFLLKIALYIYGTLRDNPSLEVLEEGRQTFEEVLTNNPSRLDIWSIYIGQEEKIVRRREEDAESSNRALKRAKKSSPDSCKLGGDSLPHIRMLYRRVLNLRGISSKKAKFLFKSFISFERSFGDDAGVQAVKEMAIAFVDKLS